MAQLAQWENAQTEVMHWITHCSGEVRVWDLMPETWCHTKGQWRSYTENEQFRVPATRANREWWQWSIFPGELVFPAQPEAVETQPVAGQSSQAQPVAGQSSQAQPAGQEVVEMLFPTGSPIPPCTEIQGGTPRPNWDAAASTIVVPDREGQGFFLRIAHCITLAQMVEAFGPYCTMREILSAWYHQRIFMWARRPRGTMQTNKRQPVAPQDQSAASGAAPPGHPAFQATARAGGSQAGGSPNTGQTPALDQLKLLV